VHTVSGIAGALRIRLFDDAVLIKKRPSSSGAQLIESVAA
jgi:hypothetical protein